MSPGERKRATYADLEALPENVVGQIIDGELIALPRAGSRHSVLAAKVQSRIAPFEEGFGEIGGWIFGTEPELHLDEDVLIPDIAGWRNYDPAEVNKAFITVAPTWICEVLSPSTAKIDRHRKLPI